MSLKFHGTIDELKDVVKSAGIQGKWEPEGSKQTFRSVGGGILNWWPNGTVQFQGKPEVKLKLEQLFKKMLAGNQSNLEPNNITKKKIEGSTMNSVEDIGVTMHHIDSSEGSCASTLLKRLKNVLSRAGLTVMQVNDSTCVLNEPAYDLYCSFVQKGSEIYIREL